MKRQITKLPENRFLQTSLCLLFTLLFSTNLMAQAPSIINTLGDKTVCEGTSPNWVITATNATSYQWEVNTGGGFVPVVNGVNYTGATTAYLKLLNVPNSFNGNRYRCIVTGPSAPPATSNEATLTVNPNVSIVTQPTEFLTICEGAVVPLSVTATGATSYQWYVYTTLGTFKPLTNNASYSGVTTSTLTIDFNTSFPNTYTLIFKCQVGGLCAGTATTPSKITVKAPPAITVQPTSKSVCAGNSVDIELTNTGSDVTYQWQISHGGPWSNISNGATYSGVNTRTLSIVSNSSLNGKQYRCILNGTCTPSVTSSAATLTVDEYVNITTQPLNAVVCPGNSTNFVVVATGTDLTYQWQVNTGVGGWTNLTNTGLHSGVTTNTLVVSNVTLAENGYLYRCNVSGKCISNVFTNPKSLTVNTPVSITSQPTNKTICSGQSTTLNTSATGSGVLTYQWYITDGVTSTPLTDGGIYAGTTTGTLNINGITAAPSAQTFSYFCDVTNVCGGKSTNVAYVTVNALPAVTTQPVDDDVCNGHNASFSVDATGTNLTYKWQANAGAYWFDLSDNAIYSNTNTKILSILSNNSLNGYQFRCKVSGVCAPETYSQAATLTVYQYVNIVTEPTSKNVCPGNTTNFSVTATGTNLSYVWQVNDGVSGWTNLTDAGIYSGSTTPTLYLTNVTAAYHTYQYRCRVSGLCISNVETQIVDLNVLVPVSISSQPTSKTICSGDATTLKVTAAGSGITSYQWHIYNGTSYVPLSDGGIYAGSNGPTLAITNFTNATTSAQTYSYFCKVTSTCGGTTSNPAYITVNALPGIATHPTNKTICSGFNTSFSVVATGTNPTYQWQVNTGVGGWTNIANGGIYSNATTNILSLTGATTAQHGYQYRCAVSGACTPTANSNGATLTINTAPAVTTNPTNKTICAGDNTSFMVAATGTALTYQWQVDNGTGWANVANGGIYSNATTAMLNITGASTAVNGYKYRCMISGTCAPTASSPSAMLTINTAPAVVMQPANTATCPGGNASFSVTATGAGLTYQWEVNTGSGWSNVSNTGIYSGATTSMLQLTGATNTENGNQYRCQIAGTCTPATTTSAAELNINIVPSITTSPTNKIICLNGATTFAVTAAGTGLTYQWQVSTTGAIWSDLLNTGVYGGVTTATLSISSAPKLINGYMYRCVVTGTCSPAITSGTAVLTVNDPTILVSSPTSKVICPSANTSFSVSATGTALTYQWQVNTGSGWANVANTGVYSGATTNKLILTNVSIAFNTYQYRCNVSGTCAPTMITSAAATLTVNTNIVIGTQPAATTTICSGDNTSLTVSATGTGIGYQWYVYNGSSYVALSNNATYTGVTTATLGINGLTATPSAAVFSYRCLVSGTCNSVNTVPSYVTVQAKPVVTSNPSNVTVCDSTNNITFSVAATGTNLTYQWQVKTGSVWSNLSNNTTYSGATTNSLLISQAVLSMNNYEYRCVVSGACSPAAVSAAAELSINPLLLPVVTVQRDKNDICAGTLVSFTATPTNGGTTPIYRWKVNNNIVATTTSATYNTTSLGNGDIVSCSMTSNATCPSPSLVNSNQLTMQVTQYQTPTATISSPTGTSACSGVPVVFNASTTYPGTMPSYQWRVNGLPVGTDSAAFSTSTLDSNDIVTVVLTSDFKCPSPSVVTSNAMQMLITQTKVATVSIATGADTSICKGSQVELYAFYTHSGANPQFEWYKNGGLMPSQTSGTLTTSQIDQDDVFACRFISSELCVVPVTSAPLKFNIDNPVVPSVDVQVAFNGGNSYTFTAVPTNGGTNPSYQWFVNGTMVGNAIHPTYTTSLLSANAVVSVVMTSSHPCITTKNATSRNVTTGIAGGKELLFDNLTLYPNPNSGTFVLAGEYNGAGNGDAVITITNALGQQVFKTEAEIVGGKLKHTVNMNTEPATGTYIMRIEFDGKQEIRRFNVVR